MKKVKPKINLKLWFSVLERQKELEKDEVETVEVIGVAKIDAEEKPKADDVALRKTESLTLLDCFCKK